MVTTKINNVSAILHFASHSSFAPEGSRKHIYQSIDNHFDSYLVDEIGPKSGTKRSVKYSTKKIHVSVDKFKSIALNNARDIKRTRFGPEGYISMPVSIDAETRNFFTNIMQQFVDTFAAGTKIRLDLGITEAFTQTLSALKNAGNRVVDFFRYVFTMFIIRLSPNNLFVEWMLDFIFGSSKDFCSVLAASEFTPEGGSDPLTELVSGALSLVVFKKTLGQFMSEKDYLGALKAFLRLSDAKKKFSSLIESFFKFVTYLLECLAIRYNFKMPSLFSTGVPEVDSIYAKFLEIRSSVRDGYQPTYDFAEKVYFLQVELESLLGKYADDRNVREKISYLLSAFRPLVDLCERNAIKHNGPRVESLGIILGGPSGVGKSTNTLPFLLAFMARVIPDDLRDEFMANHNDLIFFRNNENEFWDGMREKVFAIVYDDFGQKRDSVGNPSNDAFEIIRLINTAPYHLHFSAVEEKQRHYARAKAVFATTNRRKIKFDSIVNSEAVIRRFKISYVQVPKLEYCVDESVTDLFDRRLDVAKVRDKHPLCSDDPSSFVVLDVFEFFEWDFARGQPLSEKSLSFSEIIDKTVVYYNENTVKGDHLIRHHDYIKKLYLRKDPVIQPEGGSLDKKELIFDSDNSVIDPSPNSSLSDLEEDEFHDCIPVDKTGSIFWNVCRELSDRFQELGGVFMNVLPDVAAFAAGLLIGWRLFVDTFSMMKRVYRWLMPEYFPESNHGNKGAMVTKVPRTTYEQRRRVGPNVVLHRPEGISGPYSWLYSALKKSVYELRIGDSSLGFVTFLKGSLFFCPAHFEYMVQDYCESHGPTNCQLYKPGNDLVYLDFDWFDQEIMNNHEYDDGIDLMFMRIRPQLIRPHQDLTKFFVEPETFTKGNRYSCSLPVLRDDHLTLLLPEVHIGDSQEYNYSLGDEQIKLKSKDLIYNAPTEKGDCGSLIVCNDSRFGKPIIFGIHTAGAMGGYFGSRKLALGVSLNKKFIDRVVSDFAMESDVSYIDDSVVDTEFQHEGFLRLAEAEQPNIPSRTSIVRSPFYGKLWAINQAPAKLRKFVNKEGEEIDPQSLAMRRYLHPEPRALPQEVYDYAYGHLCEKVLKNHSIRPWTPRVFTFEEAVVGLDGVDYVDAIPRSTSPGYPHCLDNKQGGKKKWLGTDESVDLSSEGVAELKKLVFEKLDRIKAGERPTFIYVDYLKDELRPKEKVRIGKTRQFMAGPVELLILYKMYFGDFVRHVLSNRIVNGSAVGIDPYCDWTALAKYLKSDLPWKTTAGDFSGFDTRIPVAIGNVIKDVISAFYSDVGTEDQKIREILFLEIVNSRHISNGIVYEHHGGNPSGNFMTAIYNSLSCYLILSISAVLGYVDDKMEERCPNLFGNHLGALRPTIFSTDERNNYLYKNPIIAQVHREGWDVFAANARVVTFGDDNVSRYNDDYLPSMRQSRMGETIKKYFNMDYTPEDKTDVIIDGRELSQVSFLKRSFRYERGIWRAPLDIDVITETLNWQKKSNDKLEFQLRIEGVLKELSLHGKETFEKYAPKVVALSVDLLQYSPVACEFSKALGSSYGLAFLN